MRLEDRSITRGAGRADPRRRMRPGVAALAVVLYLSQTIGCGEPKDNAAPAPAASTSREDRSSRPGVSAQEDYVDASIMPGRTHVVQPKDTLFSLAQQYYGNRNQWRRIYQANKQRLPDPNNLPIGMRLIIPPTP